MRKKQTKNKREVHPWWTLSRPAQTALGCLAGLSLMLCLNPWMVDGVWFGFLWMADFRLWPYWYFIEIVIMLLFSLHWFHFYVDALQGERRKPSVVYLTGLSALGMFLFTFFHRLASFPLL